MIGEFPILKSNLLIFLAFLLFSACLNRRSGNDKYNFGFEQKNADGNPKGWGCIVGGLPISDIELDSVSKFDGHYSLLLNPSVRGASGVSAGQKQRILIARAVYKNPQYLFFDEATSALDANNEKVIMENLDRFFVGKTVVVIAHRLSTVKNADQIVVLEKGKIVEIGTHQELSRSKGRYYELVKNQLELGS